MSSDSWDSSLYGVRKPKNTHKEISSSTTIAFTTQLSSLLSTSNSSTSRSVSGRPRPSKPNLFTSHNKNTKKRALRDLEADDASRLQSHSQSLDPDSQTVLHRSKRKMEEKARIYSAMKRGDYVAPEGGPEQLIDFDRKWADNEARNPKLNNYDTSSDDQDSDDGHHEIIEFEDEHGRTRKGTRAEVDRMERKKKNKLLGAEELDRMSARPTMPAQLIYGDTVQVAAFNPDEPIAAAMEELAQKRDKSATPPPETHYEADKEIRSKGVGFFVFSKDETIRKQEMENLEMERLETNKVRKQKEDRQERRRKEVEERRKQIGEKRAKKQADSFLEGLRAELEPVDGKDS